MTILKGTWTELAEGVKGELRHLQVKGIDCIGFLTYRCTSLCRTCSIRNRKTDAEGELGREEWLRIIPALARYGLRSFEVFGGDALLRNDVVFDLIRTCTDHGIATYFPTNANLCDRDTVRKLVAAGLGTVYISIDDVAELHDGLRGVPGTFDKVREALENFVELRSSSGTPKIIICTTISRHNYRNFPRLLDFLRAYPLNGVYPRPLGEFSPAGVLASAIEGVYPEPYFASSDGETHLLSEADLPAMQEMIREVKGRRDGLYVNWRSYYGITDRTLTEGVYPLKSCRLATTVVTINPDGDVVPCPFFPRYAIGNVARQELGEIWGNDRHREFLEKQQGGRLAICRNCNSRPYYPSLTETIRYYLERGTERLGLAVLSTRQKGL